MNRLRKHEENERVIVIQIHLLSDRIRITSGPLFEMRIGIIKLVKQVKRYAIHFLCA